MVEQYFPKDSWHKIAVGAAGLGAILGIIVAIDAVRSGLLTKAFRRSARTNRAEDQETV
jgi:hypothetical protein